LLAGTGKPRKLSFEMAGGRSFRILIAFTQQSGKQNLEVAQRFPNMFQSQFSSE
jgi:hypothetical protein